MFKKIFINFRCFFLTFKFNRKLKKYGINTVDLKRSVRSTLDLENIKQNNISFKELFNNGLF